MHLVVKGTFERGTEAGVRHTALPPARLPARFKCWQGVAAGAAGLHCLSLPNVVCRGPPLSLSVMTYLWGN